MKLQTARKDHRCSNCNQVIPKGTKYWHQYHGMPGITVRQHTNCELHQSKHTAAVTENEHG